MSYDIVRANAHLQNLRALYGPNRDVFYNNFTCKVEVTYKCLMCKGEQVIKIRQYELLDYRWPNTQAFTGVSDEEFAFLHSGICHKCFCDIIRKVDDGKQN